MTIKIELLSQILEQLQFIYDKISSSSSGSYVFVQGLSESSGVVSLGGLITTTRTISSGTSDSGIVITGQPTLPNWSALTLENSINDNVHLNISSPLANVTISPNEFNANNLSYTFNYANTGNHIASNLLYFQSPLINHIQTIVTFNIGQAFNIYSFSSDTTVTVTDTLTTSNVEISTNKDNYQSLLVLHSSNPVQSGIFLSYSYLLAGPTEISYQNLALSTNGTNLEVGNGNNEYVELNFAPDANFIRDYGSSKLGIRYLGFGESDDIDSAELADYSTLANNSLVPKRYVDDTIEFYLASYPLNPIITSDSITLLSPSDPSKHLILGFANQHEIQLGIAISYPFGKTYEFFNNSSTFVNIRRGTGSHPLTRLEPRTSLRATLVDNASFYGEWFYQKVYPENAIVMIDDFVSAATSLTTGWAVTSTGAGAGLFAGIGSAQNQGVFEIRTGTTAAGVASLNKSTSQLSFESGYHVFETTIRIPILSTAAEEFVIRVGFNDVPAGSADAVDGAYFEYNRPLYGPNWVAKTADNSIRTILTTSVPVITSSFVTLRIEVKPTLATFIIDNDVFEISTNIPTLAGRETSVCLKIHKVAGTSNRIMSIDRVFNVYIPQ